MTGPYQTDTESWFGITAPQERDIRERALNNAIWWVPDLSEFDGDDEASLQRLFGIAKRFEQFIKEGTT